ncbi:hypothetical protein [Methyloglobulus sp.]|uniref:hypothetical protein n=1 Tax=Methyloglobulus sp. TaxID=2518622 RepID=UPI0032B8563F
MLSATAEVQDVLNAANAGAVCRPALPYYLRPSSQRESGFRDPLKIVGYFNSVQPPFTFKCDDVGAGQIPDLKRRFN